MRFALGQKTIQSKPKEDPTGQRHSFQDFLSTRWETNEEVPRPRQVTLYVLYGGFTLFMCGVAYSIYWVLTYDRRNNILNSKLNKQAVACNQRPILHTSRHGQVVLRASPRGHRLGV